MNHTEIKIILTCTASATGELDVKEIKKMKPGEMKILLKQLNLSIQGNKKELLTRLLAAAETQTPESAAAEGESAGVSFSSLPSSSSSSSKHTDQSIVRENLITASVTQVAGVSTDPKIIRAMKPKELKEALKALKLPTQGSKMDLLIRLLAWADTHADTPGVAGTGRAFL